jgi:hypothetical protein
MPASAIGASQLIPTAPTAMAVRIARVLKKFFNSI